MLILTNSTIVSHIQYSNYLFFITSNNRTSATCTITAHRPLTAYIYNTYCINKTSSMPQIYISVPLCCMTLPSPVCHITAAPARQILCQRLLFPLYSLVYTFSYPYLTKYHSTVYLTSPRRPTDPLSSVGPACCLCS